MSAVNCKVTSIAPLTDTVYEVVLTPETPCHFKAGQYLTVVMAEDDKRPFSIASAPQQQQLTLQIGAFTADSYAMQVIDYLKSATHITVEMPFGDAYLREQSNRPKLLVAGGTGFSYIRSIFLQLIAEQCQQPVIVYWGLRDLSASYLLTETTELMKQLPHGVFHPVIQQVTTEQQWQGKTGLVHEAIMQDINDLSAYDIYIAGRFEMVAKVRDDFIAKGALREHMYADAFAYLK